MDVLPPTTTEDVPRGQSAGSSPLRVSVIVPARNRLDELDRLLGLLEEQTLPTRQLRGDRRGRRLLRLSGRPGRALSPDSRRVRSAAELLRRSQPCRASGARSRARLLRHGLRAGADLARGRPRGARGGRLGGRPRALPTATGADPLDAPGHRHVPRPGAHGVQARSGYGQPLRRRGALRPARRRVSRRVRVRRGLRVCRRCVAAGGTLAFASDAVVGHPTRDTGRSFLSKTWRVYFRCPPQRPVLRRAIPFLRSVRARRQAGRPIGLDSARLAANGVRATPVQRVVAMVVLHVAVPWLRFVAELANWLKSRVASRG